MVHVDEDKLSELTFDELYAMYLFTKQDGAENDNAVTVEISGAIREELHVRVSDVFTYSD